MRLLTDEQHEWLVQHCEGISSEALTKQLNERFNASFTKEQIRFYKKNHGIRSMYHHRNPSTLFPKEIMEYIAEHCKGVLSNELAEMVNKEFGTNYTTVQIRACKKRHKLRGGCDTRFKPGQPYVPIVFSPESLKRMSKGWFKSGEASANFAPIGSERIDSEGYTIVKVGNLKWQYKHRIAYEEHYGPIPRGYFVTFRDGNKNNLNPDNLVAVSIAALRWIKWRGQENNKTDDVIRIAEDVVTIKRKIKELKKQ